MSLAGTKIQRKTQILSRFPLEDFVGRKHELEKILDFARQEKSGRGLLILSAPAEDSSELLRQIYDRLFAEHGAIIPFYFAFNKSDQTAGNAARRFLQSFLLQVVAFRRKDAKLLDAAPEMCEIAELAAPADGYWIDRLVAGCEAESRLNNDRSVIRQCLSAPLRAAAHGALSIVIIDDFQQAESLSGDVSLVAEIKEIYSRSTVPFVISGLRRHLLNATQGGESALTNVSTLPLSEISMTDSALLVEKLANRFGIATTAQSRDLIVHQLGRKSLFINSLLMSACDRQVSLESFSQFQQVYTEELLGGRIGRFFDQVFDEITPDRETQREILRLLHDSLNSEKESSTVDFWRKRVNLKPEEFYKLLNKLNLHEIIRLNSSVLEISEAETVLRDYVQARYRLEIKGEPRALILGEMLSDALKRAPKLMSRYYRRSAAIGLREILKAFNCQKIPHILFDYTDFKQKYKGEEAEKVKQGLLAETELFELPQIVYTTNCAAIYPPIQQFTDDERCAVALGFESGTYSDESEIVWLVAEMDSKLEADKELVEFWLDRLEIVAIFCNFKRVQFWLITPEGFSPEAASILASRHAFGSSQAQTALIAESLKAEHAVKNNASTNEFELVIPMGGDTEMIAAQAVEEIARRSSFAPKAINQIKTALIEACINASEHSLSPDRKIYQKFSLNGNKLIITIANRGIAFRQNSEIQASPNDETSSGRRGWGLKLMRKLMDEVSFEQTDDGTRIKMVKYLIS